MQVESLAVALRKRSNMEAIDLGFALARQWFIKLWCVWVISALPVFLITAPITLYADPFIASLVFIFFWWLKPLYEQPILFILSRQLFSEPVTLSYVLNNYFQIIKPQLAAVLLWRRLSLSRSFNNPVAMLEGLTGKKRNARLAVLHAQQSNSSQLLTFICVNLELLFYLAILVFFFMLAPSELIEENFIEIIESENVSLNLLINFSYFISISIIAPFYVAAGFSLYITRRTKLEGWDIELAFKQMDNRIALNIPARKILGNLNIIYIAASLCLISIIDVNKSVYASQEITIESSKELIEKTLDHEDFGKASKKKQWVYIGHTEENPDEPPEWLTKFLKWLFGDTFTKNSSIGLQVFEILIWLGVTLLIIWLLRKYASWTKWINIKPKPIDSNEKCIPNKIMGMEVTRQSLPKDIPKEFNKLLNQKRCREALSLLYRASLSRIIHQGDIDIPSSATEQECSLLVSQVRSLNEANYFKSLTHTWVLLAYGNQIPSEDILLQLREDWSVYYGSSV